MTGELSPEASAQINGAILSTSDTRTLTRTTALASGRSNTASTTSTSAARVVANAKATGAKNVTDTGAAMSNQQMGMTASLVAFMGTAAYLAL